MDVPAFQRATPAFDEANSGLRAMTGLASMLRTFDRLLAAHGHCDVAAVREPVDPKRDELLLGLLGAVVVHGQLRSIVARMSSEGEHAAKVQETLQKRPQGAQTGSLLR